MARRIVLSDASPLITLAVVCGLPWLKQLFGTVHLSSIVPDEVLTGAGLPGEKDIATAMRRGSLRVVEDRYILAARQRGLIPSARAVFDRLLQPISGYPRT
jgi:hypothetical protein